MAVSKFQSFETETIFRSQIRCAEYNPRIMGEEAQKRLRLSIRESGLVSALTWNRRTGNLVGGHQRLAQMDVLEKYDRKTKQPDYELIVCVIDVDEREEAKLNVQLNNPDSQGDWDLDKLAGIAEEFDLSLEDMGFSKLSGEILLDGDERFTALFDTPEADAEKNKLRAIKEDRSNMNKRLKKENTVDYFITVVFADGPEREQFLKHIHVPASEQYVTAEQVYRLRGNNGVKGA